MTRPNPRRRRKRRVRVLVRRATVEYRLRAALASLALVILVGTFGFLLIEKNVSLVDALFMAVNTISTVGAYDYHLSQEGRFFAVLLIGMGMTIGGWALFSFTQLVVEGTILEALGRRRVGREMQRLENHVIVCGAGRIGRLVADDLNNANVDFIVIEENPDVVAQLLDQGILTLQGNAGDEEILIEAGVERADSLVTVVRSDPENLFITITARSLNPSIFIVARAEEAAGISKLKRVGANKVVSPYHLGAARVASAVLRPAVTDFLELTQSSATDANTLGLAMEEVRITPQSRLAGKKLMESGLRSELGITVIAMRSADGDPVFNPGPDTVVESGALLVAIGAIDQLSVLDNWAHG